MSSGETARSNYNAAHTELLSHFKLRDNILLAYIAATGTILSIALGTSTNSTFSWPSHIWHWALQSLYHNITCSSVRF